MTDRLEVYQTLLTTRLIPLFYTAQTETAIQIARACAEGGAKLVEFTNRGPAALEVFTALKKAIQNEKLSVILGVGSIVDPATAALFIAHGAEFVVGPTLNTEISRLCNHRKIAYIPGCQTVNEISLAEEYGAEIVKIFPGKSVGGPDFIKDVLGPMPWCRLMPTGGVEPVKENITAWIQAGAAAVGLGSKLVRKDWLEAQKYQEMGDLVSAVIGWAREAAGK